MLALKYHHASDDVTGVRALENFCAGNPGIRTISTTMTEEQVYSLFQLSDCFVSPHRSEGFGLNIAQAMYYGKPVIATGYSGNMDFTSAENSFLIDLDRDGHTLWYADAAKAVRPVAYQYLIETSLDGKTFRPIVDQRANKRGQNVEFSTFAPAKARWVRLTLTGPAKSQSAGVLEFTVFGKPAKQPAK